MQSTDSGLQELLDELWRHGHGETAGSPQGPAQEERRHCSKTKNLSGFRISFMKSHLLPSII